MSAELDRTAVSHGPLRRNAVPIGLIAALAVGAVTWLVPNGRDRGAAPVPAPDDEVEVLVAARDLPFGTAFLRDDLAKLVIRKKVPRDSLPAAYVIEQEELLDRRLSRAMKKGHTFDPAILKRGSVVVLPEGHDMASILCPRSDASRLQITPGSRLDVLATVRIGEKMRSFPLLIGILVLAVDSHLIYEPNAKEIYVSIAVTQEEALLVEMAKQKGCRHEFLPHRPGSCNESYDLRKVLRVLQELPHPERVDRERNISHLQEQQSGKIFLPEGTELVTVPISPTDAIGFVVPGSRVDVITTYRNGGRKLESLILLSNVLVVAVDMVSRPGEATTATVSLALKKDEAMVIALARARSCQYGLLLRNPDWKVEPKYDIKKVIAALKVMPHQGPLPVAPSPRAKSGDR